MTHVEERGFEVPKFIRDRTLIEDTESTLDLISKGWTLFNYPQRLAFSATPPDFGSLLIQRRRWANGGLLIMPKLWRYMRSTALTRRVSTEVFMRAQYLLSLGPVSLAFLFVVFVAVGQALWSTWMVVAGLVYYAFYLRDLRLSGYGWADLFRVFALNLLLIPVNLCGLGLSAYQACSGYKAQFGRTPKTADRTPVPSGYMLAEFTILLALLFLSGLDFKNGYHLHGGFLLAHAAALLYAIAAFLGCRDAFQDLATLWHRDAI
jgi:hypothetical protein